MIPIRSCWSLHPDMVSRDNTPNPTSLDANLIDRACMHSFGGSSSNYPDELSNPMSDTPYSANMKNETPIPDRTKEHADHLFIDWNQAPGSKFDKILLTGSTFSHVENTPNDKLSSKKKLIGVKNKDVIQYSRQTPQVREYDERKSYPHCHHYQDLCKEVAIPFFNLTNSMDIILVLTDVIETLRRIHEAGWVNRDISGGNIYLYTDLITNRKRGMIGDLKHAKRAEDGARYDIRTGAPDFIANEIAAEKYLFKPDSQPIRAESIAEKAKAIRNSYRNKRSVPNPSGIFYNYIHDIESALWVAIWALFSLQKKNSSGDDILDLEKATTRRERRGCLFSGAISSTFREHFLAIDGTYDEDVQCTPEYFLDLRLMLNGVREEIVREYKAKEANNPSSIRLESTDLHTNFIGFLHQVEIEEFNVSYVSMTKTEKLASKRVTVGDDEGHLSKKRKCVFHRS